MSSRSSVERVDFLEKMLEAVMAELVVDFEIEEIFENNDSRLAIGFPELEAPVLMSSETPQLKRPIVCLTGSRDNLCILFMDCLPLAQAIVWSGRDLFLSKDC